VNPRFYSDAVKDAAIADYHTTRDPYRIVAARHGVSRGALHSWVNPDGVPPRKKKTWEPEEIALTNGHWMPNTRGVQIWQPCFYNTIHDCNINHQENTNAA
jgi:hypothetical protein